MIARVLRPDQGVQREGHPFGRHEASAEKHRAAQVDEEHRGRPVGLLGPEDLEVGRGDTHGTRTAAVDLGATAGAVPFQGRAGAAGEIRAPSPEGVEQRSVEVEVERIAELVGPGVLGSLPSPARSIDSMAPEGIAPEASEEVVEDLLTDSSGALRGELQPVPPPLDVAGLLEPPGQSVERLDGLRGVVADEVAYFGPIDRAQVSGMLEPLELPLERAHPLQGRELAEGSFKAEPLVPGEAVALAEAVRQELVEVGRELAEIPAQAVVAEERLHHRLELRALLGPQRTHE